MAERGTGQWEGTPPWHGYYFSGCTARKMCDLGESLVLAGGKSATRRVTRDMGRAGQGAGKLLAWRREGGGLEDLEGCRD